MITIRNIRQRIILLLSRDLETRDNDALLYFRYLQSFHKLEHIIGVKNSRLLKELMLSAPPPESIRRSRQKIQEKGRFLGKRKLDRLRREIEMRQGISKI